MPRVSKAIMVNRYKKFLANYIACNHNIQEACARSKISRSLYYKWMEKPEFANEIKDLEQSVIDTCEEKLIESIKSGDLSTVKYWLEKRGGLRGWGQKQEIEASGTIKLEVIRKVIDANGTSSTGIHADTGKDIPPING